MMIVYFRRRPDGDVHEKIQHHLRLEKIEAEFGGSMILIAADGDFRLTLSGAELVRVAESCRENGVI